MSHENTLSPVRLTMKAAPGQPEPSPELEAVQQEYLRLAAALWAGTAPMAPDSLKDREIFDLLGFD